MNKKFIPVLIVVISAAMLGLIAIQIYWINNSIKLRDAQFRYNVRAAMANVRDNLQRRIAEERMRRHDIGQDISLRLDSIDRARARAAEEGQGSIDEDSDTLLIDGASGVLQFEVLSRTQSGEIKEIQSLQTPPGLENIEVQRPIPSFTEEEEDGESRPGRGFPFRKETITNILSSMLALDTGDLLEEMLAPSSLDSLLKSELMETGGINTDYRFAVVRDNKIEVAGPNMEGLREEVINSEFGVRLFPSDFFSEARILKLYFPSQRVYLVRTLGPLLFTSGTLILVIIGLFGYTIRTIYRQKKISEIKNDFINNMTHELKTPISTISLACEALGDQTIRPSGEQVGKYVGMIRDENKRLGVLVENVLRSAILDRSEMEMDRQPVDLHQVIQDVSRNISIQVEKRNGKLELELNAPESQITGDPIHLTNMVYNLLDNAIKYSREAPDITIRTYGDNQRIHLEFRDRGIGISREDQKRIFEKLYRVPTGNVHNIKGFGLGLSYVKVIVEKHGGKVFVDSELKKGSKFTLQFPLNHEEK